MRKKKAVVTVLVLFAVLLLGAIWLMSCSNGESEPEPIQWKDWKSRIDEQRAFAELKEFAAIGGFSHARKHVENIERVRKLIKEKLRAAGVTDVASKNDRWTQKIPDKNGTSTRKVVMENVVGVLSGKREEAIALACHYDTKILPFEFVGANDGCSGIALLLELARKLATQAKEEGPFEFTIYFVFFDGEEAIYEWNHQIDGHPDNCYGSRRMANNKKRFPIETLILLDMVGDADLRLTWERRSHGGLKKLFTEQSAEVFGVDIFGPGREILDDHIPFVDAGMTRVIDLIDFDYGAGNGHWHTAADTVDKCAPESLAKVGTLVLATLPRVMTWLADELK